VSTPSGSQRVPTRPWQTWENRPGHVFLGSDVCWHPQPAARSYGK
jgi:hypothetical protein